MWLRADYISPEFLFESNSFFFDQSKEDLRVNPQHHSLNFR